jgi:hypothetical protein
MKNFVDGQNIIVLLHQLKLSMKLEPTYLESSIDLCVNAIVDELLNGFMHDILQRSIIEIGSYVAKLEEKMVKMKSLSSYFKFKMCL